MARRRTEDEDISLFPFLSILASVIGVLTLLISTLALSQMDVESVAAAEEYAVVQAKLKANEEALAEVQAQADAKQQQLASDLQQQLQELAATRQRLEEVEQQLKALQELTPAEPGDVPGENPHRERIEELQQIVMELRMKVQMLQKQIADRKKPPEEAQTSVLPSGSGVNFVPRFVECDSDAVVLHTENPPLRIPLGKLDSDPKLAALIKQAAGSKKDTIVLLLRDDGLGTYYRVRKLCDDGGARHGKLPVIGDGRIDLSNFR